MQILTVIAPLFLIIFGSALLQKWKHIGDDWSKILNDYALKIGLPVLIFSALAKAPFSFFEQAGLIIANSVLILASFLAAVIIGNMLFLGKQMRRTLFMCFAFGNVAYLGIPVLIQTFGEQILPVASLIVAIYSLCFFTIGIGYLDYSTEKNKETVVKNITLNLLKNPLLLSVFLGIIVGSMRLTLPTVLLKSLDMITASVTPTVLIVIGLFIGKSKIGKLSEWFPIFLFSVFTLMMLPAIFYYSVKFFGFAPNQFSSSIIEAAMPLAITPFALADQYHLNKTFIVRSIVLSTILSVISLPFWISLLL